LLYHLWTFISENPVTVGGWVVTFLIAGLAAPYVAHWLRRREEKRTDHLAELARNVLQPMLTYLDQDVLPILRHEAGNVDVCISQVPASGGLAARSDFKHSICVRMVTEPLQVFTFGMDAVPPLPAPPDGPLVDDARQRHFADLFRVWDAMVVRFQEYNDACLRYVETLRAQVVEQNEDLPEFILQSSTLNPEWVNAAALAVIVFLRQIGLSLHELYFSAQSDPKIWLYGGGLMVAQARPMKMVTLEASVNTLLGERGRVQQVLAMAKPLATDAAALRATIDELRLKRRLSGKCQYL
jgi:hypothetical protein